MTNTTVNHLLHFLQASPSPFHACANLALAFEAHSFRRLDERNKWELEVGKCYYYTRSDASFVAFKLGKNVAEQGVRLIGAHTDSPCLKIKPTPDLHRHGYNQLGVEVYGGALLNPWFDRDLSLAGKVTGLNQQGDLVSCLVNFEKAMGSIPSLAIHLDREANKNKSVNAQQEMNFLLAHRDNKLNFRELLLAHVQQHQASKNVVEVLDFNICAYDVQPPAVIGLDDSFIASARLDNLLSCYVAAESLQQVSTDQTAILVCNDHEEVGSRSELGAQGTILNDLFARITPKPDDRQRMLRHSLMLSIDNAHGIHPNYADRHDASHGPLINQGPVIKFDADQGYATSSDSAAFVRLLAKQDDAIPLQSFVMRADSRCGSTIGPITATNVGIKTVDIGVPQFAMHSTRELAGVDDVKHLRSLVDRFICAETIPF